MSEKTLRQIEEWKKRLIDLTKKNQLIYFKPSRKSLLEVKQPSLQEIWRQLTNEKDFTIWLPPEEKEPHDQLVLHSSEDDEIKQKPDYPKPDKDDIVFTLDNRKDIENRLKLIYRKALSDYQEKGIRTSAIVIGLLAWKEKENDISQQVFSPVIIYPIEISKATPKDPYKIIEAEEDVLFNPALKVKIENDFRIHFPVFEPEDILDLDKFFNSIEDLGDRDGWKIEQRAFVGNFSFHKMAMYQDLDNHANQIAQHPIIRGLAEGYVTEKTTGESIPSEKDLDKEQSPERMLYILDADSSQAKAIETAIKGHSFVLKGPPGTGKSQTISNIIAEFLEKGKNVLFVSEKMAALEVVHERLKKAHLNDFCLELHSHKANKKAVVAELLKCLEEQPEVSQNINHSEIGRLIKLRNKLNDYVLELHLLREPMGESLYKTFEKLSKLSSFPSYTIKFNSDDYYSPMFLSRLEDLVNRLINNYIVLVEGESFPWRGFRQGKFSFELKKEIEQVLVELGSLATKLITTSTDYSSEIGIEPPKTIDGCLWLIEIAKLLLDNPMPDKKWLMECNIEELIAETQRYSSLSARYHELVQEINEKYSDAVYKLPGDYKTNVDNAWNSIEPFLKDREGREVLFQRYGLRRLLEDIKRTLEGIERDINAVCNDIGIGISGPYNLERAKQLSEIASLMLLEAKPDKKWLDLTVLPIAQKNIEKLDKYIRRYNMLTDDIASKYDSAILEIDYERLIEEFSSRYKKAIKYFLPKYYSDMRRLKGLCKSSNIPGSILEDLKQIRELKTTIKNLNEESNGFKEVLGVYFEGFDTNIERLTQASQMAKRVLELVGEYPLPSITADIASNYRVVHPEFHSIALRLKEAIVTWERLRLELEEVFDTKKGVTSNLNLNEINMGDAKLFVLKLMDVFNQFDQAIDLLASCKNDGDLGNYKSIKTIIDKVLEVKEYETNLREESARLQNILGHRFDGFSTDWGNIVYALRWTKDFLGMVGDLNLSEEFYEVLSRGNKLEPEAIEELNREYLEFEECLSKFESYFDNNSNMFSVVRLSKLTLDEISEYSKELVGEIDKLRYWFDYASIHSELINIGCEQFLKEIVLNKPKQDDLIGILHKAFYSSWVNRVCERVKVMGEFRGIDHERVISEYRMLDKKLNNLSSILIINELNSKKPKVIDIQGSEVSALRNEGAKKRKHLPLRRLFEKISNLIPKIKPCLLMSPLSVSHYINLCNFHFDVVIFDEASQICSEDAVGAIARGDQLIVAGDNKQLPPTKFFESGGDDDEDFDESQEDSFAVYQSVLDDCERIGLTPAPLMLKWHYRSKHESLIAYSNKWFYRNLVTFPCSKENCDELGVKHVVVEDGIYDRGGKRNNIREAERVADLVIEHFRKYGADKTLGVVALNISQRDAIQDVIELKRRDNPELEKYFVDDRLSGFFVKNLESVQGDERDVIVLSLGYGKDQNGKFSMNFGPINKEGGERRLNVVVTRAKEKFVLVSSVRASDFDINHLNSDGARHLYHYIDYAERGKVALELSSIADGDVDSPFEEDVKFVIKNMGYEAVSQVGCSGFRVDLGVIDPANPGRFMLGIECDGRTYHSAFTARERDRIRQEILEKLGWRIHRIWSPDWFYNRELEIDRLQNAIETARTGTLPISRKEVEFKIDIDYKKKQVKNIKDIDIKNKVNYKYFKPRKRYSSYEFNLPQSLELRVSHLKEIIEMESPIHKDLAIKRLIGIWNVKKIGSNIDKNIEQAIRVGCKRNYFYKKGNFLWSDPYFKTKYVRIPISEDSETLRPVEFLSPEEIQTALLMVISHAMSIEKENLFTETARLFGWNRNSSNIDLKFDKAFSQLLDDANILINQNKISISN